jgi:hypothetical protein
MNGRGYPLPHIFNYTISRDLITNPQLLMSKYVTEP